ncbi:MAG TPA: hypothetical protein VFD04_20400 [Actinomycetes bacterium]|jgi:hypothetical protein|nr:hypothetical protein [Actinomycetes bacterium]
MDRARTLAAVSAAQLACGVAGMVVALRRVHPYDVFWMRGRPEAIARDTLFKGTALSAPVSTLVTQAALTAAMARHPSRRAAQGLRMVGVTMVAGYLGERLVRQRLRPSGWDALESPLVVAALGLSVGMAALGRFNPSEGGSEASPVTWVPLVD